jgi:hypothetical protein
MRAQAAHFRGCNGVPLQQFTSVLLILCGEKACQADGRRGGPQRHRDADKNDVHGEEPGGFTSGVVRPWVLYHAAQELRPDHEGPEAGHDQDDCEGCG